ncbi:MAG: type I-C CRISPR-associated protein Cas8c/Csd1, partial [Candidatus Methanomethylophilaceae archaeon]|nr:type I-C CRISPR-associated protein Cas8c/Csd1 [Candidatus Methanomethylophilaceae archaeon]
MGWINSLIETYDHCIVFPDVMKDNPPLLPVFHNTNQAHIEIQVDWKGDFVAAMAIPKDEQTSIIPCTEDSAVRSSGMTPHPLADKMQYVMSDYESRLPSDDKWSSVKKDSKGKVEPKKKSGFAMYSDLLKRWCDSEYSDVNANAVLRYVHKKSMFDDLVRSGIVIADDENHFCFRKDVPESVLFSISKINGEQYDAFIRWSVLSEDGEIIPLYATQTIFDSWRNFYASLETSSGLCLATGKNVPISTKHPSKIRHSGDKAKLISSNDSSGFTYRGRFEDSSQACGIGVIATQKAHNALKWLIGRQGYRCDDLCVVTWSSSGEKTLNPVDDCSELFELDAPTIFTGEEASTHLNNRLRGYCSTILDKNVYVMMLDSATEGRLSILMYREYLGEELISNMERWHKSLAWNHNYKFINKDGEWKRIRFVGAPTPRDIIDVAYGDNSDSSLVTHTVKTLMHCIVDGLSIPSALIDSAIRHASNPNSGIVSNHEKAVSVACSLFKHQNKGGYELTLEEDRRSRDYL